MECSGEGVEALERPLKRVTLTDIALTFVLFLGFYVFIFVREIKLIEFWFL